MLARAEHDPDFAWNAELVRLVGDLPPARSLPVLRRLWGEHGLDEVLLPVLARHPQEEDRDHFVAGLGSAQPATVRLALDALERLPRSPDRERAPDEVLALVLALRRLPAGKEEDPLRRRLQARLRQVTGQEIHQPLLYFGPSGSLAVPVRLSPARKALTGAVAISLLVAVVVAVLPVLPFHHYVHAKAAFVGEQNSETVGTYTPAASYP